MHIVSCCLTSRSLVQVWGVVCDNASNNAAMMNHLGKFNLKRLNGMLACTHCLLHILNLVAQVSAEVMSTLCTYTCSQAVMEPFSKKRQALAKGGEDDSDDDIELVAKFDLVSDTRIKLVEFTNSRSTQDEEGEIDHEDDGTAASRMLTNDDKEETPNDEEDDEEDCVPEIVAGSAEERELIDSTMSIWKVSTHLDRSGDRLTGTIPFKVSKFAHKIRYSPRERAAFRAICEERSIPTPHNVRRDVKTRWNSTENMRQDAERTFNAM